MGIVIAYLVGSSFAEVDYCAQSTALCGVNVTHVACNSNKGFAKECVNATQITMSAGLKQTILNQHNLRRSQVANGKLAGFPAASNMLEMVWKLSVW